MKISFLSLGLLLVVGCSNVQGQQNPNLAEGKKYVSSDPNTKNWGVGLTDGSWTPERGQTFATGSNAAFPKNVTLDLEETKKLGYIALGVPPFGSTKTVNVATSIDGIAFSEIGSIAFPAGQEKKHVFNFQPVNARYIRLTYLDHYLEKYNFPTTYAFTTELAAYAPGAAPLLESVDVAATEAKTTANPNLARGKKFISSDPNTKKWGEGLTDGSWLAGRGTTYATGSTDAFPKNVTLDLEEAGKLGYIALGVPPFGSTKTVSVSLSVDGTAFTEVGRNTFAAAKEARHIFDFQPTTARYVRVTYLDHYPETHGYQATYAFTTELEVYAPGVAPVLPNTPVVLEPADVAAPKLKDGVIDSKFSKAHESFLQRGKEGPVDVLFIGDSITDYWRRDNVKEVWARFAPYNPANFGIGGDKTQHILWRFENGELDNVQPKVVVLMVGTNNTKLYSVEDIVKADTKIVKEIHRRLPNTKILLLGIFPRGAKPTDLIRAKIKSINSELSKLDDGNKTRYFDIGNKFLEVDGTISPEVLYDALHPAPKGYQIWADAISPLLVEMMR